MTPEELEAFREWYRKSEIPPDSMIAKALEHIDQQAASLDEADALTKKNAELMNGYLAGIAELETTIREKDDEIALLRNGYSTKIAQVVALQEIAIEEGAYRAYYEANARTESYADFGYSLVANGLFSAARDRLAKEHPEAFR